MTDNLALWQQVEKTPPNHVKAITGKSYSGNSPKPYYLVQKATETFGPCGIGWGFDIIDERVEDGAGGDRLSIARVRVWYQWDGKRGEVEHIGGTPFSGTRKSGQTFVDEDAPKKSVTDALVKALSMIGFAGDIFMGRYDDSKYVAELHEEAKATKADDDPKPVSAAKMKEGLQEIDKELLDCHTIADVERCAAVWRSIVKRDGWAKVYRDEAAPKFQRRKEAILAAETFPDEPANGARFPPTSPTALSARSRRTP